MPNCHGPHSPQGTGPSETFVMADLAPKNKMSYGQCYVHRPVLAALPSLSEPGFWQRLSFFGATTGDSRGVCLADQGSLEPTF